MHTLYTVLHTMHYVQCTRGSTLHKSTHKFAEKAVTSSFHAGSSVQAMHMRNNVTTPTTTVYIGQSRDVVSVIKVTTVDSECSYQ